MRKKIALLTGANGQDASYLAEILIDKGYIVHGTIRRNSVPESQTVRIDHLREQKLITLHYMDLTDPISVESVINSIKPDELYHLAAQSHVQVSYELPKYTLDTNAGGTLSVLESVKKFSPKTKVYHAATSEMFGNSIDADGYQRETTKLSPVSPYGCSKLYAHSLCQNYRNAYNLYICSGILFNHECVAENSPIIVRSKLNGVIDIVKIKNIVPLIKRGSPKQQWTNFNVEAWDGENFVDIKCVTATKRPKRVDDFKCVLNNTRHGVTQTTKHHNLLLDDNTKVKAKSVAIGDKLLHGEYPLPIEISVLTREEAKLIGLLVSDGHITDKGKIQFTNNDTTILNEVSKLWEKVTLKGVSKIRKCVSGFNGTTTQIRLLGHSKYACLLRGEIYDNEKFKKIPARILNANKEIQMAFLIGYNMGDGLKSNPCTYEFKNFKTNSILLAQGLLFLINNVTKQGYNITVEARDDKIYYSINLLTDRVNRTKEIQDSLKLGFSQRKISEALNITRQMIRKVADGVAVYEPSHLVKDKTEIKKQFDLIKQPDWVFDIEVDSGKIMAGVGTTVIANSPRRGVNFVTNKVVLEAVKIKLGLSNKLILGNLNAYRDWGHAKDYMMGAWLMMQQEQPKDYVLATGKTHSVNELVEYVFNKLDLSINDYVETDKKFERSEELRYLKGDATKAKNELGWSPTYTFNEIIDEMIDYWLTKLSKHD